jgi:hypothetical protein
VNAGIAAGELMIGVEDRGVGIGERVASDNHSGPTWLDESWRRR